MSRLSLNRVCHLLLGAADEVAGVQQYIASLAESRSIVILNAAPQFETLLRAKKIKYYVYSSFEETQKILLQNKIKILHCHLGQAALVGFGLSWTLPNLRLVYTQHFIRPASTAWYLGWLSPLIFWLIFKRFHKIIAISEAVRQGILQRQEAPLKKIALIYNGRSISSSKSAQAKEVRKKVLTVCRLQPEKNPYAVLALARFLPDWTFTICGGGRLLAELKKAAPKNCFIVGPVEKVTPYLRSHSFLYHPAPAEPFGLILIEALAQGLPVVAIRGGAAPEIVVKGCGLLTEPNDYPTAVDFFHRLAANPKLYARYAKAAYEQAKFFSLETMRRKIYQLYAELN